MYKKSFILLLLCLNLNALTIVTDRTNFGDSTVFSTYEKDNDIIIEVIKVKKKDIKDELDRADILFLNNGATIYESSLFDYLAKTESSFIDNSVQINLKDLDNKWVGITKRASFIVYNKNLEIFVQDYSDLTNYLYTNKIVVGDIDSLEYKTLFSNMFINFNAEKAKYLRDVMLGSMNEFNRNKKLSDKEILSILEKNKFISVIPSDIFIEYLTKNRNTSLNAIAPNQYTVGTHINISTASILKSSKDKNEAKKFLEFLVSKRAQDIFQSANYEYPTSKNSKVVDKLKIMPSFVEDINYIGNIFQNIDKFQ